MNTMFAHSRLNEFFDIPDFSIQRLGIDENRQKNSSLNYKKTPKYPKEIPTRISFGQEVLHFAIMDFLKNSVSPKIRPATIKETFSVLRNLKPLQDGERIVCFYYDTEVGDDVLIIQNTGPVIIPALNIWDKKYHFSVTILC